MQISRVRPLLCLGTMIVGLACTPSMRDHAAPATPWTLQSQHAAGYTFTATGGPETSAGATLTLASAPRPPAGAFGRVAALVFPAGGIGHRVYLSAEVRPTGVVERATIWLQADSAGQTVSWSSSLAATQGTSTWVPQAVELVAPAGTRAVRFGALLVGAGSLEVRALRIRMTPIPPPGAPMMPAAAVELEDALAFLRPHAEIRNPARWAVLEGEARRAAAGAATPADVYPALRRLVQRMGDSHAYLMSPLDLAQFTGPQGAEPAGWTVRAMGAEIGYLEIPAYMSADTIAGAALASSVLSDLARVRPEATCGWVVDLRRNGGGTYPPMLAVAGPFLGRGALGAAITDRDTTVWRVGRPVDPPVPPGLQALARTPVAVLTGPETGSAGEVMTLAFHARPNTRSFGSPTAGLTSAGSAQVLPSGAVLSVSAGWYADRTGVQYHGAIPPDVSIAADSDDHSATDRVLDTAARWLRERCVVRGDGEATRVSHYLPRKLSR